MSKQITDHKVNGLNDAIQIIASGETKGGAPAHYDIKLALDAHGSTMDLVELIFQNKPIQGPEDFNGITNEALLAVILDRMRSWQEGEFKCRENAIAITHLEEALMWMQKRTRDRMARGVEGTYQK